jgi:hypothetical protein
MRIIINAIVVVLSVVFGLYITVLPYYNWQYAREHGLAEWLAFGEIIPTYKALAWPYFAFFQSSEHSGAVLPSQKNWSAQEITNSRHFLRSIQADLQSKQLARDRVFTELNFAERNKILMLKKTALREIRLVDENTLRKIHPDLPGHATEEYIPGLENLIRSLTSLNDDPEAAQKGVALFDNWVDWWNANRDAIFLPE